MLGWSLAVIFTMFLCGLWQFRLIKEAVNAGRRSQWLSIPFSLLMGWISVATIANISIWCVSIGWHGGALPETTVALITISATTILAIAMSIGYRDWVYPLVIGWALIAIYVAFKGELHAVADPALISGIISIIWAAFAFINYRQPKIKYRFGYRHTHSHA
jgi:hypothetical protein